MVQATAVVLRATMCSTGRPYFASARATRSWRSQADQPSGWVEMTIASGWTARRPRPSRPAGGSRRPHPRRGGRRRAAPPAWRPTAPGPPTPWRPTPTRRPCARPARCPPGWPGRTRSSRRRCPAEPPQLGQQLVGADRLVRDDEHPGAGHPGAWPTGRGAGTGARPGRRPAPAAPIEGVQAEDDGEAGCLRPGVGFRQASSTFYASLGPLVDAVGHRVADRMRPATPGVCSAGRSSQSTTNSSPPSRVTVSPGRISASRRRATSTSTASPAS